jgi:hypothetical protein
MKNLFLVLAITFLVTSSIVAQDKDQNRDQVRNSLNHYIQLIKVWK